VALICEDGGESVNTHSRNIEMDAPRAQYPDVAESSEGSADAASLLPEQLPVESPSGMSDVEQSVGAAGSYMGAAGSYTWVPHTCVPITLPYTWAPNT